ncbi:MAG: Rpn family recombination-promoting nuclease/putative transposase [Tannerellaceae bacterium]|jgi:predicted transposase/invertase (TIGR01784 family)|nr:Rpn family recombination-promoting nuclease/putative transposase [Tannerellaceae bacterium]
MTSKNNKERVLVSFDWALKRLLRNKADFDVVEGFLSELLERPITITDVLESESNKEHPTDKHNRVDVVVKDDRGEIILIELQFILEIDYFQRMLYGASKAVVERMEQGDKYMKINKVYSINIVYFDLGHGKDYVYWGKTHFKGIHDHEILKLSEEQHKIFEKIEAGDLFPEYYILKVNNFDDVAKTSLDEWIYFLKNNKIKENFRAKGLIKARDILDFHRFSQAEQNDYNALWMAKSHARSQIASAKQMGESKAEAKYSKAIKEKDKAIKKQDKALKEKDKALKEQKKALEEQKKEIEELKRLLNKNSPDQ